MFKRNPLKNFWLGALCLSLVGFGGGAATPAFAARGWLGVSLQELGPKLREALDLDEDIEGALIAGVVQGSPAEKAGIHEGDVLVSVDGKKITTVDEAVDAVGDVDPGDEVDLEVYRDGSTRSLTAVLADRDREGEASIQALRDRARAEARRERSEAREEAGRERDLRRENEAYRRDRDRSADRGEARDDDDAADATPAPRNHRFEVFVPRALREHAGAFLGVRTFELGDQLAAYFGVPEGQGVLIIEVVEDSPAARAGLRAGDVILSVGDAKVTGPEKLRRLIQAHDPDEKVDFEIQRKGDRMHLEILLGSPRDFGALGPGIAPMLVGPERIEPPLPPEPPEAPDAPLPPEWHEKGEHGGHVLRYVIPGGDREKTIILDEGDQALREVQDRLHEELSRLHEKLGDQRLKMIDLNRKLDRDRIRWMRTPRSPRTEIM